MLQHYNRDRRGEALPPGVGEGMWEGFSVPSVREESLFGTENPPPTALCTARCPNAPPFTPPCRDTLVLIMSG